MIMKDILYLQYKLINYCFNMHSTSTNLLLLLLAKINFLFKEFFAKKRKEFYEKSCYRIATFLRNTFNTETKYCNTLSTFHTIDNTILEVGLQLNYSAFSRIQYFQVKY